VFSHVYTYIHANRSTPSLHRGEGPRSSWRRECTTRRFADNIAHKTFESVLSYDSIDVVYTWVRREEEMGR